MSQLSSPLYSHSQLRIGNTVQASIWNLRASISTKEVEPGYLFTAPFDGLSDTPSKQHGPPQAGPYISRDHGDLFWSRARILEDVGMAWRFKITLEPLRVMSIRSPQAHLKCDFGLQTTRPTLRLPTADSIALFCRRLQSQLLRVASHSPVRFWCTLLFRSRECPRGGA